MQINITKIEDGILKNIVISHYVADIDVTEVFLRIPNEQDEEECSTYNKILTFLENIGAEYMNECTLDSEDGARFDYFAL